MKNFIIYLIIITLILVIYLFGFNNTEYFENNIEKSLNTRIKSNTQDIEDLKKKLAKSHNILIDLQKKQKEMDKQQANAEKLQKKAWK